jgi:hypothetical protein
MALALEEADPRRCEFLAGEQLERDAVTPRLATGLHSAAVARSVADLADSKVSRSLARAARRILSNLDRSLHAVSAAHGMRRRPWAHHDRTPLAPRASGASARIT